MVKMCMDPKMEFIHHNIESLSLLTCLNAGKETQVVVKYTYGIPEPEISFET